MAFPADSLPLETHKNKLAGLESQFGPQWLHYDIDNIIVEKTDIARDGDMVIALLEDGSATLKKLYHQKNYIRLQPANSAYKSRVVKNVVIQGRVMGILRTYRG